MGPSDSTLGRSGAADASAARGSEWPPGWAVTVVESTGSTNADLLAAVAHGAADRTVLIARHQTAGRGRLQRRWEAPPGTNLLMSVLFRNVTVDPHRLVQRLGLATRSVAVAFGAAATLKWPNDLLVGPQKLAGILAEARPDPVGATAVVVGLGLNVGWAPAGAACLGTGIDPLDVARSVLIEFDRRGDGPIELRHEYRQHLATLGRRVRVELAGAPPRTVEGRAVDVDDDGCLVVLDDCALTHRIAVGDVVHLR